VSLLAKQLSATTASCMASGSLTTVKARSGKRRPVSRQQFENREFHDWYRFVWGYSDHLVAGLLAEWDLPANARVLDPFCGTGTTLVECMKRGFSATGVDASPASVFVSQVKTRWSLDADWVFAYIEDLARAVRRSPRRIDTFALDKTFRYLTDSGMLERGWISTRPLGKALAIKRAIGRLKAPKPYRDFLTLALLDTVVQSASNMKFGPELYVANTRYDAPVLESFLSRALVMACDLASHSYDWPRATVIEGDSRRVGAILASRGLGRYHAVICSPPYPAEHDYTRNARLELAFLEAVTDVASVRKIKQAMIRSHTKGIYANDRDWRLSWLHSDVSRIARSIERRVAGRTHGFARLYSKVVESYFGGMLRHFKSLRRSLRSEARCAYVVSDQASFVGVHIPTAHILADAASAAGFDVEGIRHWRTRRPTTGSSSIDEEILLLKAPAGR
jgi:hypothetical protein